MNVVIASGYFNPLHKGHIQYLEAAKSFGDELVVIVNNDPQVRLKGSTRFMDEQERRYIVSKLRCVDEAFYAIDYERSVSLTIELIYYCPRYRGSNFLFANGGDVTQENCRETEVCRKLGIPMVFGVGGTNKVQSSSELLKRIIRP